MGRTGECASSVQGLHHGSSRETPSLSPSIFTSGQWPRKNLTSAHELICEQCLRPSPRWLWGGLLRAVRLPPPDHENAEGMAVLASSLNDPPGGRVKEQECQATNRNTAYARLHS